MNIIDMLEDPVSKIIIILLIIITTSIIVRLVAYLMNKMKRFKKDITLIYLIRDIINYIIYFIALMSILQIFDINLAGTLLSLGIVGIAVSFAAKDSHIQFLFRNLVNNRQKCQSRRYSRNQRNERNSRNNKPQVNNYQR